MEVEHELILLRERLTTWIDVISAKSKQNEICVTQIKIAQKDYEKTVARLEEIVKGVIDRQGEHRTIQKEFSSEIKKLSSIWGVLGGSLPAIVVILLKLLKVF